jgi:hypothetical protein
MRPQDSRSSNLMGFFKPAGDDADEAGASTDGDGTDAERAGADGGLSASAEGEDSDALEDLGVDLDAGGGLDGASPADS